MLFDSDLYCRAALYPRFEEDGHFAIESFLRLTKQNEGDWYAMSVGNRQFLKSEESAHAYGCSAAKAANDRMATDSTGSKVHYIGFYDLTYGAIRNQKLQHYTAKVRYAPTEGEAHYQIELWDKGETAFAAGATKRQKSEARRTDRLAFVAILAKSLSGPFRHTCLSDAGIATLLEGVNLPTLPPRNEQRAG